MTSLITQGFKSAKQLVGQATETAANGIRAASAYTSDQISKVNDKFNEIADEKKGGGKKKRKNVIKDSDAPSFTVPKKKRAKSKTKKAKSKTRKPKKK
jgi:vacuolar-type H+-ATPase subunit H